MSRPIHGTHRVEHVLSTGTHGIFKFSKYFMMSLKTPGNEEASGNQRLSWGPLLSFLCLGVNRGCDHGLGMDAKGT